MDDNDKPILYGVSHIDGVTPIAVQFDAGRKMRLDFVTTIQFDPTKVSSVNNNGYPLAKATSSVNDKTCLPWVVNASTGAVLASST